MATILIMMFAQPSEEWNNDQETNGKIVGLEDDILNLRSHDTGIVIAYCEDDERYRQYDKANDISFIQAHYEDDRGPHDGSYDI